MIEIITPGIAPGDKKYGGRCTNCGCVVKCSGSDTKVHDGRYNETLYSIACPTCKQQLFVEPLNGR